MILRPFENAPQNNRIKEEESKKIETEVAEFIAKGGNITVVPRGKGTNPNGSFGGDITQK